MRFRAIGVTAAMVFTIGMVPGIATADEGDFGVTEGMKTEQTADGAHEANKADKGSKDKGSRNATVAKRADQVLQSEFALLKSDGWLYRADKDGNALDGGRDWTGENPLAGVKTLFVDAKVPTIGYDSKSGLDFSHPAFNLVNGYVAAKAKASLAATDGAAMPLACLNTVVFKTNDKGKSLCASIGEGAFEGSSIQKITNFDKTKVAEVGERAFSNCARLTEVVLPARCSSLGGEAFAGCTALTGVTLRHDGVVELADKTVFAGSPVGNAFDHDAYVYVPKSASKAYSDVDFAHSPWQRYRTKMNVMPDIADALVKVSGGSYTGSALTPEAHAQYGSEVLEEQADYVVRYSDNTDAGVAQARIVGTGKYDGSKVATFSIVKADNEMTLKAKTVQADYYAIYYDDSVIKHPITVKKASGELTYKLVDGSADGAISIDKKTGDITIAKQTSEGTYPVKVKVKAAGDENHRPTSETVEFKINIDEANSPVSAFKFMAVAQREYDEGIANGSGHRGDSKYWSTFVSSYQPWCSEFVGWCLLHTGLERGVTMPSNPSYAKAYYNFYSSHPEIATVHVNDGSYSPQPGDIVLQQRKGSLIHTEMVTWSDGYNYGGISGGSRVSATSRSIGNKEFYYFITIKWDAIA